MTVRRSDCSPELTIVTLSGIGIGISVSGGLGSGLGGGLSSAGEGGVLNPVVNSSGKHPVHDDHTDVHEEVADHGDEVRDHEDGACGVGSHDEGHESNPLECEGSETSHGHGAGESSTCSGTVSSHNDDPGNGEGHPGGDEHVDHGLMVLVVSVGGVTKDHVQYDGDNNEDVSNDSVDQNGSERGVSGTSTLVGGGTGSVSGGNSGSGVGHLKRV